LADSVEKEEAEQLVISSSPMIPVDVENDDEMAAQRNESELFRIDIFFI
jgi:hypothetical protein